LDQRFDVRRDGLVHARLLRAYRMVWLIIGVLDEVREAPTLIRG
jgi:hypothetical protein